MHWIIFLHFFENNHCQVSTEPANYLKVRIINLILGVMNNEAAFDNSLIGKLNCALI